MPTKTTPAPTALAAELQQQLVDLVALGLVAKQAHWNVVGPQFRALHLQLDEIAAEYLTWQDEVAERATALGAFPDVRPAVLLEQQSVKPIPAGRLKDADVARLLVERLDGVIAATRTRVDVVADDLATQDIVIQVLQGLEKQRWMLRAQLA